MANFSVECLARSYYEEMAPETKNSTLHSKDLNQIGAFAKEPRNQYTTTCRNNSCGNSSGSESEMGDDSEGEVARQRRLRTKFTSVQITKLENTFSKHKYLGATQRRKIAEALNLSETQVKTWFQNRRMKQKREFQDKRTEFLTMRTALLSPMLFQHPLMSGQLPSSSCYYPHVQPLHRPVLPSPLCQHSVHPVIMPLPRFF